MEEFALLDELREALNVGGLDSYYATEAVAIAETQILRDITDRYGELNDSVQRERPQEPRLLLQAPPRRRPRRRIRQGLELGSRTGSRAGSRAPR